MLIFWKYRVLMYRMLMFNSSSRYLFILMFHAHFNVLITDAQKQQQVALQILMFHVHFNVLNPSCRSTNYTYSLILDSLFKETILKIRQG